VLPFPIRLLGVADATSAASATPLRRSLSPSTECTRCFLIPTGSAARTSRSDRPATVGCASSWSGSARRPSGPPSALHVPANSCSATARASGRSCVSLVSPHLEPLGESRGRATTLPGDAAYPTTPSLGQGACHAMRDAGVLARCLAEGAPPSSAFSEVRLRCDLYSRFAVQSDRCAEYHPRRCPNLHGPTHRASIQSERSRNASHGSTRTSAETSSG
jgi:hypothetical protein